MMENQKPSWFERAKPFIAVVFLQTGFAGMEVLSKAALNKGMSNYVLVVYRHGVAFSVMVPFAVLLDKQVRPKMTFSIFMKIVALSVLEPVIDQNLYFLGMKYTTATFAAAMTNILPAVTFVMACIRRLERFKIRSTRSQAKVFGTLATVAGATVMTLVKGPVLELFGTHGNNRNDHNNSGSVHLQHVIKGSALITISCFSWACFMILQAITLETYPAALSLAAWICLLGSVEGAIVALVMERGKPSIWSLNWDTKLLAVVYTGVVCSGITYYIQGVVMKSRGPVFVTAFSPLNMVIVAIMGSIILGEQLYLGSVIGAIVIVLGLYLVVWGKSKDCNSPTPTPREHILPDKISSDEGNARTMRSNHDVIAITHFEAGIATREEQKWGETEQ